MPTIRSLVLIAAFLGLNGCAVYTPQPLPRTSNYTSNPDSKASHPLGLTEVAQLAVLHNSELKIEREKKGIKDAQAFQAGLLPNPQLSANVDQSTDNAPGLFKGYSYGLTFDLLSLITHPSDVAISETMKKQAKEDLLWQEWQIVARARMLFVQSQMASTRATLLSNAQTSLNLNMDTINAAVQSGDLAADQADSDIAILMDIQNQLASAKRKEITSLSDLGALLNLAPDSVFTLQDLGVPETLSSAEVNSALSDVINRRPDLVALREGYAAQEETVFKAVLSQFPNLQIGFTKAKDTSNVHTTSFGVTLNLPIFDQGQGHIAIERATRAQLRAEYQNRINQTNSDAAKLQLENHLIEERTKALEPEIPLLRARAVNAASAARAGDLSIASETQLIQSWLGRQNEMLDLKEALWTNAIALDTLLASPLNSIPIFDKAAQQ
ncbi:MAG: TolC family protein [Parvibaculaceae bacterium]